MFLSCMRQRNACANVFANPSKSLNYEITCKCYSFCCFCCASHFNPIGYLYSIAIDIFFLLTIAWILDKLIHAWLWLVCWLGGGCCQSHTQHYWLKFYCCFCWCYWTVSATYTENTKEIHVNADDVMWMKLCCHHTRWANSILRHTRKKRKIAQNFFHSILKMSVFA